MRRTSGLHAEITLTTALLVAAALLFGGVLLLRLTEQALLAQRTQGVENTLQMLADWMVLSGDKASEQLPPMLSALGDDLLAWRFDDAGTTMNASSAAGLPYSVESSLLIQQARMDRGPQWVIERPLFWFSDDATEAGSISAAIALGPGGRGSDVLWVKFSLASMQQQLFRAYRLLLLYVLLYGGVLTVFGVVALRRNVVRPVRRLQQTIDQVAAGDLDTEAAESGPREIADLANSFNTMTRALKSGREALLRSERMASVGHLSAGMAHEIGNPLAAVIGYLEVLKGDLPPGRTQDIVRLSLAETARIDRLVRDLLDYATPDRADAVPTDPAPIVKETLEMLGHQAAFADFALALECPASLPTVSINPHKLQQVLVNLIGNARDASVAGQTIGVSARVDGQRVLIDIHDQGEGVPEALKPHIFDPFFSTKTVGQGRGLGLTVCHRIVAEVGGEIAVASQPGSGSTFTISLPVIGAEQD